MDFEFDKEMDVLLRQTAQGETAFAAVNPKSQIPNLKFVHLDADEISAFAENALPEKARQAYVLHLVDCDKCRKNLSSLIALNAEQESEIIHAKANAVAASPIPWYRNLFAVPNLAYAMGMLVLIFSGIAIYTVLQSTGNFQNSEISQAPEKQIGGKGMSSDGETVVSETYSSNVMMSNTAAMNSAASSNTAMNASNPSASPAPVVAANSNMTIRREPDKDAAGESKVAAQNEPMELAKTQNSPTAGAPPPSPVKENEVETENQAQNQQQNSIAQNQTQIMPDSRSVQNVPRAARRDDARSKKKLEDSQDDAALKSIQSTSVGGKTFKRENNVWYDAAYRGQATKNITRGTGEYKKLDSGLRAIAENLGGTIVVVWKAKAYRIQ